MRKCPILVAALALAAAACQPMQEAASLALTDADRAAIESQSESFRQAMMAKDFAAAAALFTEDAVIMPPNQPMVEGRAAIQEYFANTFGDVTFTEFTNAPTAIEGSGNVAFSRAPYTLAFTAEGMDPVADEGKYIATWEKQPDGTWLCSANPWNSDLPLPEMEAEAEA